MSPGFTSRPSLSGRGRRPFRLRDYVSPGFTSRPSLSGWEPPLSDGGGAVSPGFTSRPSLSGCAFLHAGHRSACRRDSRPGLR